MTDNNPRFETNDCYKSYRSAVCRELTINGTLLCLLLVSIAVPLTMAYQDIIRHTIEYTHIKLLVAFGIAIVGGILYITIVPVEHVYLLRHYRPNKVFAVKGSFDLSIFCSQGLTDYIANKIGMYDTGNKERNYIVEGSILPLVCAKDLDDIIPGKYCVDFAYPKIPSESPVLVLKGNHQKHAEEVRIDLSSIFAAIGHEYVEVNEQKLDELLLLLRERWSMDRLVPEIKRVLSQSQD